jgi:O-antigen biosynthesis protein
LVAEIMLNSNYLTHFCVVRMERMRTIGGWDSATDGAQDWDLFLRAIGNDGRVVHVPYVLYHWRHIETSVASGGMAVKPFAAAGQLRTLKKFLSSAGCQAQSHASRVRGCALCGTRSDVR